MKIDNKLIVFLLIAIIVMLGVMVLADNVNETPKERGYVDLDTDKEEDIEKHRVDEEPEVDSFREGFMDGCTSEGANADYCTCIFDYFEEKMTKKEMAEMALEYEQTGEMPDEMIEAVSECIDKY